MLFSYDGTPLTPPILADENELFHSISVNEADIVVTWERRTDGFPMGIRFSTFSPSGAKYERPNRCSVRNENRKLPRPFVAMTLWARSGGKRPNASYVITWWVETQINISHYVPAYEAYKGVSPPTRITGHYILSH